MKEGRERMDEGGPERASVGSRGNRGKKRDAWGARAKKILNQRKFEEEKNTRKMVENRLFSGKKDPGHWRMEWRHTREARKGKGWKPTWVAGVSLELRVRAHGPAAGGNANGYANLSKIQAD